MIDYNLNYYRPSYASTFVNDGDTDPVADTIGDIWGYYNPFDPNNTPIRGNALDNSIYLWYMGKDSSAATNTCISIAPSQYLNFEVKEGVQNTDVPLAMCLYAQNFNGGFRVDPSIRLAYDITKADANYGGWRKACLINNINPLDWCLYPTIAVYSYNTHSIGTFRTLANLVSYLTADPTRRVISIRSYLYRGTDARSNNTQYWIDGSDSVYVDPVAAPLAPRPICDNLSTTVGAYIAESPNNYKSDEVYNPFNQAQTTWFFSSDVFGASRQHDIGFAIQIASNSLVSGRYPVPDNNGRATACFAHINTKQKIFDDVVYHWRTCIYDEVLDRELPEGFDLSSLSPAHNCRVMSVLEIDDKKNYVTIAEATKAAVLHEVCYWGFWVVETTDKAINDPLGSASSGAGVYLPEKIGGVTTGNYFTGEEIKNVPYADSTDTSDFEYKGFSPEDGETGDFNSRINSGAIGCGVSYYSLNAVQVNSLCTWLNTTYEPTDQDEFIQDFKGVNPGEYITTMMFYPFEIPHSGSDVPIVIGKLSSGVNGFPLDYTYGNYINFDSYTFPKYGDFRDYLMKISVTVPFCGTRELDPRLWAGRTLYLRLAIDYPTGAATCYFYRDNYCIDSISGTIGVPLPLSAVANGSYQVAITNLLASHKSAYRNTVMSALGLAGGIGSMAVGAATGNLKLALGGAVSTVTGVSGLDSNVDKMDNIDYNIDHTAPTVSEIQGGSPFINCGQDYRAKVFICTPKFLPGYNAGVYGKTTGYATSKQGVLSQISKGFTRCASADLSGISCTSTERKMIFDSLQSGVII